MSYKSGKVLDGYAIVNAFGDGYNTFLTPWIDVHSSPWLDFGVNFSTTPITGTMTVECSSDKEATWKDGSIYPASAQFIGTYGTGPFGDPVDLRTVTGSTQSVTTNSPNSGYSLTNCTARFYRIKFVSTTATAGMKVTVTQSWKSAS